MKNIINEKTVMQFYIECLAKDEILFLQNKVDLKAEIMQNLDNLCVETK